MRRIIKNIGQVFCSFVLALAVIVSSSASVCVFADADNGTVIDFENMTAGDIVDGSVEFVNDWGNYNERKIVVESMNKSMYFSRRARGAAAFAGNTFNSPMEGDFVVEFSAKFGNSYSRQLKLYNSAGETFLTFEFGTSAELNGSAVTLEDNTDNKDIKILNGHLVGLRSRAG